MNLNKVMNVFVSDGAALPANNTAVGSITAGKVAVIGKDMTALDPGGNDTVTTQPDIYLHQAFTNSDGQLDSKRSSKIKHTSVIGYSAKSYTPATREVWAIGYNRKSTTGTIEVAASTEYNFSIRFKHEKHLGSERPIMFNVNFTSSASATKLSIATDIASLINNGAFKKQVSAVVVGNGTGAYGLTSATEYGVEITAKDIEQFTGTNYNNYRVYFSVHVNDSTGFGTTTTCTQIQANTYGIGTSKQVKILEDLAYGYEGVRNRTMWPIPQLTYFTSDNYTLSAAIVPTCAATSGEDVVTFSATVAAMLRAGEKVELDGANYEIKYFIDSTHAVLTSVMLSSPTTGDVKVRTQYDLIYIDFNDTINTPGANVVAVANKQVIIAVPALDAGDAYNGVSAAGQDFMDILNPWMLGTPGAFANISI